MKTAGKIFNALIFLFLYAPIFVVVFFSFNSGASRAVFDGFSLVHYQEMFEDELILSSLYYSLIIAVLSAPPLNPASTRPSGSSPSFFESSSIAVMCIIPAAAALRIRCRVSACCRVRSRSRRR